MIMMLCQLCATCEKRMGKNNYHRHSSVGKNDIICMSLKEVDVKRGWERTTEKSMIGLKHATKLAGNDLVNKVITQGSVNFVSKKTYLYSIFLIEVWNFLGGNSEAEFGCDRDRLQLRGPQNPWQARDLHHIL